MKDAFEQQSFDYAIEDLSRPEVYSELMLASTPEAAMKIAQSLEPVQKLIEMGADAGSQVLDLLQRGETLENDYVTTAELYVVSQTAPPGGKEVLARLIANGSFDGINNDLSSRTFLNFAGIEATREETRDVAFREAQNLQNENASHDAADNAGADSKQETS